MDSKNFWKYTLAVLALLTLAVWIAVFAIPDGKLHIIACDVGQGDAILIQKSLNQILIDAGPNSAVLTCLSRYMPFWDRKIELAIMTHPQSDHFTGLIDVFKRYKVGEFLSPNIDNSTQTYQVLKNIVRGRGFGTRHTSMGMKVEMDLMHLDILNPPEGLESKNLNDYSIVAILSYKNFDALLTGDIENEVSDKIAEKLTLSESRTIEYLKVPHHGSRNGLSKKLLQVASPQVAVISVGKNNRYGHPHREVLEMLSSYGLSVFRTDDVGDVEIVSDGERWWVN